MAKLNLFVHQAQHSVWADSRGVLSRLTRSVELADSGSWASSCEEFRWGLQIRFVRFSIYLVERSVSLSRELCGHRDWVNSRYEPKRIQKITQRRPNEQREQKPNLFGLCRVASEEEEFNRTSSESRSLTCLDLLLSAKHEKSVWTHCRSMNSNKNIVVR